MYSKNHKQHHKAQSAAPQPASLAATVNIKASQDAVTVDNESAPKASSNDNVKHTEYAGMINAQMDLLGRDDDGNVVDRLGLMELAKSYPSADFSLDNLFANGDVMAFKSHVITFFRDYVAANYKSLSAVHIVFHNADYYVEDVTDKEGTILHHKGEVKIIHAHFVIIFRHNTGKTLKNVRRQIYQEFNMVDGRGQSKNRHIEAVASLGGAENYLTHTFQPAKMPYSPADMVLFEITPMASKGSKFKALISEDIGNVMANGVDTSKVGKFWYSNLHQNGYLNIAGGVGDKQPADGQYEQPSDDCADAFGEFAVNANFVWHYKSYDFGHGEAFLERQSGKALKQFMARKADFDGVQVESRPTGSKKGGSKEYHGKVALTHAGKHANEVERLIQDIRYGYVNFADAERILREDWGAKGTSAYYRNKELFKQAQVDFVQALCAGKIDGTATGMSSAITVLYMSAAGGSGKDGIMEAMVNKLNEYRCDIRTERQPKPLPDIFKAVVPAKGVTVDLFSNYLSQSYTSFSDVDGSAFYSHFITDQFDPRHRASQVSARNNNSYWMSNYAYFTNSDSLSRFWYEMLESEDRVKYCEQVKEGKDKRINRYPRLTSGGAAYGRCVQMARRMPFYITMKAVGSRRFIGEIYIWVNRLQAMVKIDEFKSRKFMTLSESAAQKEADRIGNIIADWVKYYDWSGEFGHKQQVPWANVYKYQKSYDLTSDSTSSFSLPQLVPVNYDRYLVKNSQRPTGTADYEYHYQHWVGSVKSTAQKLKASFLRKNRHLEALPLLDAIIDAVNYDVSNYDRYSSESDGSSLAADILYVATQQINSDGGSIDLTNHDVKQSIVAGFGTSSVNSSYVDDVLTSLGAFTTSPTTTALLDKYWYPKALSPLIGHTDTPVPIVRAARLLDWSLKGVDLHCVHQHDVITAANRILAHLACVDELNRPVVDYL